MSGSGFKLCFKPFTPPPSIWPEMCLYQELEQKSKREKEALRLQLIDKQTIIDGLNKEITEKNETLESTVQKFNTQIEEQNQKLKEKNIQLQGMRQNLETIERLTNENKIQSERTDQMTDQIKQKYEQKYEKCRLEKTILKRENNKMKKDITVLKKRRLYYETQYKINKCKFVAKTHTQSKQKLMYGKVYEEMAKNNLHLIDKIHNDFTKLIDNFKEVKKSETLQTFVNTIDGLKEENKAIEEQEKKIMEKRADGRVSCGSCDQTFGRMGDLSNHITSTHKI